MRASQTSIAGRAMEDATQKASEDDQVAVEKAGFQGGK